jgi:hypothetical protein
MTTDIDLEIIHGKQRKIKLNGKRYKFRRLTVQEHLEAEFDAQELEKFNIKTREDIPKLTKMIMKYITQMFEIPEKDAEKVSFREYQRLRLILSRVDMYDQGFNDKEIDQLEKKAIFRSVKEAT